MAQSRASRTAFQSFFLASFLGVLLLGFTSVHASLQVEVSIPAWIPISANDTRFIVTCVEFESSNETPEVPTLIIDDEEFPMIKYGIDTATSSCAFMCSCNLWRLLRLKSEVVQDNFKQAVRVIEVAWPETYLRKPGTPIVSVDGIVKDFGGGNNQEFSVKTKGISMAFARRATTCDVGGVVDDVQTVFQHKTSAIPVCNVTESNVTDRLGELGVALFRHAGKDFASVQAEIAKDPSELTTKCSGASLVTFTTPLALLVTAVAVVRSFEL